MLSSISFSLLHCGGIVGGDEVSGGDGRHEHKNNCLNCLSNSNIVIPDHKLSIMCTLVHVQGFPSLIYFCAGRVGFLWEGLKKQKQKRGANLGFG